MPLLYNNFFSFCYYWSSCQINQCIWRLWKIFLISLVTLWNGPIFINWLTQKLITFNNDSFYWKKTAYHIFRVSEVLKLLQLSNLQEVFLKMLIFHYHKNSQPLKSNINEVSRAILDSFFFFYEKISQSQKSMKTLTRDQK